MLSRLEAALRNGNLAAARAIMARIRAVLARLPPQYRPYVIQQVEAIVRKYRAEEAAKLAEELVLKTREETSHSTATRNQHAYGKPTSTNTRTVHR